ncbi:MAG: DUF3313 domain-containing protein [Methylococcales bacterium]|nr:DUF3313 domain-containing protein [Methylococcales bacterium]MDD5632532.1 DUF3313 domain-containing protein [Methylococcales bacterium]
MSISFKNSETKRLTGLSLLSVCLLLLSACSTTQKVAINQTDLNCAFIANECSLLTPGGKGEAGLRYINPAAKWTQYNKILIDPVTFWAGDSTTVSASNQQMLVDYFSQQLKAQLGQKFEIVSQAGPGVMKLDLAIVDASSATPLLRSISMLVPQARALSSLKYLATGTYPFVGGAQAEAKVTDSVSGEILALAVDKRIGGGAFSNAFQWKWGDAENVVNEWINMITTRLSALTSGTASQ